VNKVVNCFIENDESRKHTRFPSVIAICYDLHRYTSLVIRPRLNKCHSNKITQMCYLSVFLVAMLTRSEIVIQALGEQARE
jgi:hypothetical protein